jgi:stage V sporulation protein D (sporulation-specific penicillin-binding protein)
MSLTKSRIRLLSIAMLLVAGTLIVKLYSVQIIHGSDFAERADRQYQKPTGHIFSRGTIYFTEKSGNTISAATVKTGFILAINPKLVQKAGIDTVYASLKTHITDLDYADFYAKASKQNDTYEEIRKKIDEKTGEIIAVQKIAGTGLYKDKWRYYPGGSLAAHVLGLIGFNAGNELAGRYGLERSYQETLLRDRDSVYVNFFAEMFSNIKKTVLESEKFEGDIVTSIEPDTQQYIEQMLAKLSKAYNSERSGAIIMDPKTGEIIAMALAPTFDPNNLKDIKDPAVFSNNLVESVYEMGSVVKPLTMAVGIDTGKVTANTVYHDKGSVTLNNKTIYNFDKKGRGDITLQYALSKSLNTGFVYVAQQVGNKTLADYFLKFGIGEKTKIDLPNESTGLVKNLSSNIDIEFATASFGQGIAMSPIAILRAYSAIANQGELVQPHVVKKIKYRLGYSKDISAQVGPRVIKPETARAVTDMMVYNVDRSLLDGKAKNERYAVAAKTGTAQIATSGGTYDEYRFLHSFVGFLPAYNPRFLVFIYTVNPRGVNYASETLAQPFVDLSRFLINHYELPPDR